jgi:zinc/manganese transport system substrate-binding protein
MPGIRIWAAVAVAALLLAGCGPAVVHARAGQIAAIGAENQYADVISQIGGRYVAVGAIERNPNTDPHSFEASPSVAQEVGGARLVVQNGLGYDTFMDRIESATPSSSRTVIDVQRLLGLPSSTSNPHLWYLPRTMPAVAHALVAALSRIQPDHAAYFTANERRFDASLAPWLAALRSFASRYPHAPVAVTEPVGDYMLRAAGANILTPFGLEADIMNGIDPAPQAISLQNALFSGHRVKAFLYNQQVTDSVTQSFLSAARRSGIPVIGLYETMPTPGYDYQTWMLAEVHALGRAVGAGASTESLLR